MLMNALGAIFATVVVAAAAFGMGGWMWGRLPSTFSRLDRLACTWLGGLGVLGALLFFIGQIAFTSTTIFLTMWAGVALAIGFFARQVKTRSALSIREIKIPAFPAIVIAV